MNKIITVIVPARSEEKAIIETLEAIRTCVKTPHEVIVVHDKSDPYDATGDIVRAYQKKYVNIRLFVNPNPGFASALLYGIKRARCEYLVFFMGDGSDDPRDVDIMYRKIKDGWDVVCGSRYMEGGGKVGGPKIQGVCSRAVNEFLHRFIGIPTHDASNAFRMYRTSALKAISIDTSMGVECSLDMALQAYDKGLKITEVTTVWRGRTKGFSKFSLVARAPKYAKVVGKACRIRLIRLIGLQDLRKLALQAFHSRNRSSFDSGNGA